MSEAKKVYALVINGNVAEINVLLQTIIDRGHTEDAYYELVVAEAEPAKPWEQLVPQYEINHDLRTVYLSYSVVKKDWQIVLEDFKPEVEGNAEYLDDVLAYARVGALGEVDAQIAALCKEQFGSSVEIAHTYITSHIDELRALAGAIFFVRDENRQTVQRIFDMCAERRESVTAADIHSCLVATDVETVKQVYKSWVDGKAAKKKS